ncbi:uncharacterized protein [Magallana gigas]|uniref:uncharacterized protein isoform X2 n=1 Tax=Magallana gigas TaxID=29159 RepID=UPI00333E2ED9
MEAIKMTFLTIHLILNTIYVILVDRVYPILLKDEENKGVLKILWLKLKAKISEVKVQSSFKAVQWLGIAYNCYDRFFSHYSSTKFSSFCDTNVGYVFDIAAVYVSYLVPQIIINVLSIIMLDRLYSYLGDISVSNGAFRSAFGRLYSSLKSSKMKITFFVILCLMLSILMRIIWIASDVTTLSLSSTILHLSYCLCGPGPVCLSSLYYSLKQEVCRNSYLLFHASGTLVAYLVVNACSHIFELTVCSILSKKTSSKISPNDKKVNGTKDQEESLEIGSFDDDL